MAKIVLAVSGGIDSMTMLDLVCKNISSSEYSLSDILVAHFDHGTRPSAHDDAKFVRQKAAAYGVSFVMQRAELGDNASEALAREQRYDFLRSVAGGAEIYTAHHLDDLAESIVINFLRGTGWRGLAVLNAAKVRRPFLEANLIPGMTTPWSKKDIFNYAARHNLTFREDPTNASDEYLRNRLRHDLNIHQVNKEQLFKLWQEQKQLKFQIEQLLAVLFPNVDAPWQRTWFRDLDQQLAIEILRYGTKQAGISATRPQLEDFRQAILSYNAAKCFNLPGNRLIRFGKTLFYL